jgi:hypothetical protein
MTLPFKEPAKYYFKDSFYWLVLEKDLIQYTENFFNQWKAGTELYYYKRRELSGAKPIDDKQGEYVWRQLEKKMKTLIPKKETA